MNDVVVGRAAQSRVAPEHRLRAGHDLMCRIPIRAPRRIADVFCGQGSMRPLLARRFPDAEIEAFDLSQSADRAVEKRPERFLSQVSGFAAKRKLDLSV